MLCNVGLKLGNEGAHRVCEALMSNTSLTELNLCSKKSDSWWCLQTDWVKWMTANNISDEGAGYIGQMLKENTSLIEINLDSKLAQCKKHSGSIKYVWPENEIKSNGAIRIGDSLRRNTTLMTLSVNCELTEMIT